MKGWVVFFLTHVRSCMWGRQGLQVGAPVISTLHSRTDASSDSPCSSFRSPMEYLFGPAFSSSAVRTKGRRTNMFTWRRLRTSRSEDVKFRDPETSFRSVWPLLYSIHGTPSAVWLGQVPFLAWSNRARWLSWAFWRSPLWSLEKYKLSPSLTYNIWIMEILRVLTFFFFFPCPSFGSFGQPGSWPTPISLHQETLLCWGEPLAHDAVETSTIDGARSGWASDRPSASVLFVGVIPTGSTQYWSLQTCKNRGRVHVCFTVSELCLELKMVAISCTSNLSHA